MTSPSTKAIPVDRGWSWVILAATFLNLSLCSLCQTVGVFNLLFLQQFDTSHSVVAACGALQSGLIGLSGPFVSVILSLLGARLTITLGGVFVTLGFFLTYFATSIGHLFVTFGFMTGCGIGICLTTGMTRLGFYFDKYRNLAYGLATSAFGFGMIGFPPVLDKLFQIYGLRGSMLILSAIFSHMFIVAMVMLPDSKDNAAENVATDKTDASGEIKVLNGDKPTQTAQYCDTEHKKFLSDPLNQKRQQKNTKQTNSLKNQLLRVFQKFAALFQLQFVLYSLNLIVLHVAMSAVRFHLPAYSYERGSTTQAASLLITVIGIGNIISRLIIGVLTNNRNILMYVLNIITELVSAVVSFSGPYLCGYSYAGQVGFSFVFSLFGNAFQTNNAPIAIDILGLDAFGVGYGVILMMCGIGMFIGPPITGAFYDMTQTYYHTFVTSGICYTLGVVLIAVVLYKRQRTSKLNINRTVSQTKA